MVFNWFRRQFTDKSATPQEEVTPGSVEPEAEPTEEVASSEPSQDATADYLNWAKAAYKNIQQQSQAQEAAAETESSVLPPESAQIEVSPEQGSRGGSGPPLGMEGRGEQGSRGAKKLWILTLQHFWVLRFWTRMRRLGGVCCSLMCRLGCR